MRRVNCFLIDVATGILISFIMILIGGWYFYYLPVVTVIQGLFLGLIYGLLRWCFNCLMPDSWDGWLILGVFGFYIGVWLTQFSSLLVWKSETRYLVSILIVLVVLGIAEGLRGLIRQGTRTMDRRLVLVCLLFVVIGLLTVKGIGVAYMPYATVDHLVLHVNPISSGGWFFENVRSVFYPFSVSMEAGMDRYSWLVGSSPGGNHIFLVVLDSLRQDRVGTRVGNYAVTPTLETLQGNGTSFDNYYVQASWTKPSTASLFTGRYLREHGTFLTWNPPHTWDDERFYGQRLPARFRTLAERLKNNGYSTFGAVSISHIDSSHQFDQGFDRWFDPAETYNEDYAGVQRLLFWLMRKEPKKSFTYLHMVGPHYPYETAFYNRKYWRKTPFYTGGNLRVPGERFTNLDKITPGSLPEKKNELRSDEIRYLRHLYQAKLNLWDRKIVRPLFDGLRASGFLSDNHFIVTADHGEELYDYRGYGHKNNMREVVLSPPLIVRGPRFQAGETSSLMVESTDLGATVLDLAGHDPRLGSGRSILNSKSDQKDNQVLSELGRPVKLEEGVDRQTIHLEQKSVGVNLAVVRDGSWKLYHQYNPERNVLINLEADPGEMENVTGHPELRSQLKNRIFEVLGSDGNLKTDPPPLIRAGDDQLKNLEGLGYLQ